MQSFYFEGARYNLLCLVDFVRRNNPEREIGSDRRILERKQPQGEGTSEGSVKHVRLSPPNTTQIWRTKEQMISMGEFNLESFRSENGKFFLRVKTCNKNFFLFSEWPYYTFYYVDECPNQIKSEDGTPVINQFLINETNFRVKYKSGSLMKPLPHLNVIKYALNISCY